MPLISDPAPEAAGGGPIDSAGKSSREVQLSSPDGAALIKQGHLAAAEEAFRQEVDRSPNDATACHNLAVALARQGKLADAVTFFREALARDPTSAETHRNLALALSQLGRRKEGEHHWREAVRLAPDLAAARHELGNCLRLSGRLNESLAHLREAVRLRGDVAEVHQDLGMALAEMGQSADARKCYETALRLRPEFPEALNNLGILLEDQGAHFQAEAHYRAALKMQPRSADTLNNLGVSLAAMRRHEEAADYYRQSLQLKPGSPLALNNLGNALRTLGEVDEAMHCLRKAIASRPDYAEAHNNLGISLMEVGRLDEAMRCYEQALHLRPHYPEAHLNRALAWLGGAELSRGWTEYEWRWCGKEVKRRSLRQPLWSGALAKKQTLFLYFEQGMGDTLQFIRYVELAQRRAARVVVEVQESLVPLLSRCRGIDELIPSGAAAPGCDFQLPLMSLPGAFGTRLDSIPADVPYIFPDPERVTTWKARLSTLNGFRVGIGWQGNPQYRGDRQRSIPVERFAPLAEVPGVQLVSLQKGEGTRQIKRLERSFPLAQFDDLDSAGGAFLDTAAILANLDLVITSDTALAHLAGAMGVATWIALPFASDWRWFRDRDDSPWYPTVRLFRQNRRGDWQSVFERIVAELTLRSARHDRPHASGQPPAAARAEFQCGTELAKAGNHIEAVSRLRAAVALHEGYAEAHHNLGVVLARSGMHRDAIAAFRRTLEINPDYGEAAANLGLACLEAGAALDSVVALRQALRCGYTGPDVYNHLGVALSRSGKMTEAIDAYRTALRLQPDFAPAHINLAHAFLALGRLEEAWMEQEWQWSARVSRPYKFKKPRWSGEPLKGRTILVYADETDDDVRRYIKHAATLHEHRGRVIVVCRPEMTSIVGETPGIEGAVPLGDALPDHDLYVPLLSLPWLLSRVELPSPGKSPQVAG